MGLSKSAIAILFHATITALTATAQELATLTLSRPDDNQSTIKLTSVAPLETWTPPVGCWSRTLTTSSGGGYDNVMLLGCQGGGHTCCPPGWRPDGFYGLRDGATLTEYTMVTGEDSVTITRGSVSGRIACPTYPFPSERIEFGYIDVSHSTIMCQYTYGWTTVYDGEVTSQTFHGGWANGIIVFPPAAAEADEETEKPTATAGTTASITTSRRSTQEPPSETGAGNNNSDSGNNGDGSGNGGGGGLSNGAIAGISVGVGVPIILALLYAGYRLGRRKNAAPVAPPPAAGVGRSGGGIHEDGGGNEPGIAEVKEYGGIQDR